MGNPSQVIALVEDQRQRNFVQRYLQRLGYPLRAIRFEISPTGKGSAEQWVRDQYAKNVGAYRIRAARAETALIVAIDSDNGDVDRRLYQFQSALSVAGLAARTSAETIVHLVPKRNIETWILCLTGTIVTEEMDYSGQAGIDERIKPAAEELFEWSRPNVVPPNHCVPSLSVAIPEVRRLEH
jgi:hypothetical protein